MTEPKYTYRIPPCPAYDIPGMESWLEDMAARGWHLCQDGFFAGFASFEQVAPRRETFRLEATATNGGLFSEEYAPEEDAIEMNEALGWTYRARRGQFHIYSAADPDAPELNTDPQVQAITIGTLGKYLRKSLIETVVMVVIDYFLLFTDVLVSSAIAFGTWRVALVLGLLLWGLVCQGRAVATLSRLRRKLQSGEAIEHRRNYQSGRFRHVAGNLLRLGLWIFVTGSLLVHSGQTLTDENAVALEDYAAPFPFATLSSLYPEAEVRHGGGFLESEVTVWTDFLAPENFDYAESSRLLFPDGTSETFCMTVNYHRTRWAWTADLLAKEFISQAGDNPLDHLAARITGDEAVEAVELDLPQADYAAYYYRYRDMPYVVIRKDNVVVRVNVSFFGSDRRMETEDLAEAVLASLT